MPNGRRCARQVVIFSPPGSPTWPADDLARASFRRRIKRYSEDQRGDLAYAFFVFRKSDDVLVGGLTLANIRRGCAQAGSLGYWMGAAYARQGHMTAAVNCRHPVRIRHFQASPGRSRLHSGQRRVGAAAGKNRFQTRGVCPAISLHRWGLAGPPALRTAQGRPVALIPDPPWGRHGLIDIRHGAGASVRKNSSYFNASGA